MFRVWGKIFKDNHMLRDTVVCDDSNDTRTHKVMRHWKRCVTPLTLESLSGWNPTSGIFNVTPRPDFTRTALWKRLISTIWNFR